MKLCFRVRFWLVLLALVLACAGCWDREELENLALVLAIGFDTLPDGRYEVTTQVAIPTRLGPGGGGGGGAGGGGGQGPPTLAVTRPGRTIFEAFRAIGRVLNRRPTFAQTRLIIIGEHTARRGIKPYMALVTRDREFRRTMYVMVIKGRAKEALSAGGELEKDPAEYLLDLAMLTRYTGETDLATVNEFLRAMESHGSSPTATYLLPPPKKGGEKTGESKPTVSVGGVAVFRGDRMVGIYDPDEAPAFLMLRNRFIQSLLSIPDPEGALTLQLTSARSRVTPYLRRGRPSAEVSVKVEADLVGTESGQNYVDEPRERQVERAAAAQLTRRLHRVIQLAQQEFRADPFGLGEHFRTLMPDWAHWVHLRLGRRFPGMAVRLRVKVYLRRFGLQRQSPAPIQ